MHMISKICRVRLLFIYVLLVFCLVGCSSSGDTDSLVSAEQEDVLWQGGTLAETNVTSPKENTPPRDNTPMVLTPEASGVTVHGNEVVTLDISNASKGYVMLTYSGTNQKVKFQITVPGDVTYTYLVTDYTTPTAIPLTGGSGTYSFTLLESADVTQDLYAIAYTQTADVQIEDAFLPYLSPNVYVDYATASASVAKGVELAQDCYSDLDVIGNIYHYVTQNITYDTAKAQSVPYGYIPDPDDTLAAGTGICFDYASLMSAMLRSQQIPTRLEVGYAGEAYHAWISCYVDEIGWIDNIIEFDGENWSLMDPTLAANNSNSAVQEYIGDGSKYVVKYTY